ncbi:type I secretion C-terminal target domain-containing protein [Variovorax sp. 3P27G3]|uniref:type I secretion C-terminal target domain-containing protein n=1 Tax=Variovorax sp. 3P27G3 TaxID=2502214 RepID=UPI0024C263DD|nr:type I secretion C-terminal target domain-containing protein [Variovorax sp. 3P27G3]
MAVTGTAWSHTTSENLKEGKHNYEIRVVDTAGNLGAAKAQTVTIDTTPPTGNITVNALSTADTTPTITGNVSGLKADESVWVTCNGVTYKQGVDAALKVTGSTWSLAIPDSQPINKDGASDAVLSIDARIVDQAGNAKSAGSDSKITVYRDASVIRSQSYDYMAETQPALIGRGKIGTGETMFVEVADSSGNVVKKFSSSSSASGVKMDAGLGSWSISPEAWGSTHLANGSYTVKAYVGVADGSGGQESGQEKFEIVQPVIHKATDDKGHVVPRTYALADGSYWIFYAAPENNVFTGPYVSFNLYAQKFSQQGTPIGAQVAIAAEAGVREAYSFHVGMKNVGQYDVAFKSDGSFGVFYATFSPASVVKSGENSKLVYIANFDADGKLVERRPVQGLTNRTQWDQNTIAAPVYVDMPDGRHVLLYAMGGAYSFDIYQIRYNADGTAIDKNSMALTSDGRTNGFSMDLHRLPGYDLSDGYATTGMAAVAVSDSKYVMLYTSQKYQNTPGLATSNMFAQVYDFGTGRAVGAEIRVNSEWVGTQMGAQVLRLKEGGLVAVWLSDHTAYSPFPVDRSTSDNFDVYAKRLAWDEATQSIVAKDTQEVRVNTTTNGANGVDFWNFSVHFGAAALAHGGYVVVWSKFTSRYTSEVYGQTFDAAGNKLGGETLISVNGASAVDMMPRVTELPDGGYVVTWVKTLDGASSDLAVNPPYVHGGTIQSIVVNADGSIRGSGDTKTYPVTASYIDGGGTLNGNDAVNTLDGRKGASVLNAGGGNDYIIIKDTSFTSVDGGAGNDTLIWDSTQNLNFSDVAAKVKNIETIHLGDKNANTLKLSLSDVLGASGTTDTLVVLGGRTDRVVLEDSWSLAGSQVWRGEKYNVYSNKEDGAASLWVQAGVSVDMTAALRTNDAEPDADGAIFISPLGAKDTVLYKLLAADHATGGNDVDALDLFTVGDFEGTADANRIDLKELLVGYMADADGAARYIEGVATIDAGDSISEYLSTTVSGGNTMLSIDRDGSGNAYSATPLVTLNGVTTDLATLLANHQLVLA